MARFDIEEKNALDFKVETRQIKLTLKKLVQIIIIYRFFSFSFKYPCLTTVKRNFTGLFNCWILMTREW